MKKTLLFAAWFVSQGAIVHAAPDPAPLYRQHCVACHGVDRLGGLGPALLPQNLERLKKPEALAVITAGRPATQMQGFKDKLKADEIQALADFIYTPPAVTPQWGEPEIRASRYEAVKPGSLPDKPSFSADPLNLFVVVEAGDHHVTILDGDKFEPIHRFPSRFALHGGPKFTPDGRYVFFASRDGWISKFDIYNLKVVAEIRAGINTRNIAVSGDGQWVMAANYLPQTLVLLKAADLSLERIIPVVNEAGKGSRVSAVYAAAPRKSFVAALKDIPELWEMSYDPKAKPVFKGYVHDYKMGEAVALPGQWTPRVTQLDAILDDFFFSQNYAYVLGAARPADGGNPTASGGQVVNLDIRRKIADLPLPGLPHLGSGISWTYQGRPVMATPNLKDGVVSVIDMKDWKIIKEIKTAGPAFFMRSHENTPYAWVDAMMGQDKDTMQLLDKNTLEIVKTLRPEPGKTAAHTEFTRDGKYALVSIWEDEGALVIYDAATLKEVKRLPMRKPVGKYNVYNKITRSEGTSH
ncbi:MAG TPA: cytochrome D1 domain-containing protein [Candidatus Competibacter sp.]|nr:cytochrome D1 domain-containing protein [Candidatus Competibacter sp.]HUM95349.1 cytochrome D1 domain-containing protein [Candidatus Competibacter sp.]